MGARRGGDLYDMRDLATLRLAYPALTLVPVAEADLDSREGRPSAFSGPAGRLPEVVARHASFRDTEVYVAGRRAGYRDDRALAARVPSTGSTTTRSTCCARPGRQAGQTA